MAETHRDQDDPPQQDKPIWDTALSAAKVTYWGFKAGHLILTLVSLIGGVTVYKLTRPVEHIDVEERAIAAKLKPSTDLVREEIRAFRSEMRRHFDDGRYADLERAAQDLRATKALFRNGTWKLTEFYEAFTCERDAPEAAWQQLESRLEAWQAAMPQSLTAHLAYANFLTDYAWHARGSGYANTVTKEGWKLLRQRLTTSGEFLKKAQSLPDKDPMLWLIALRVGLGTGWMKQDFEAIVAAAHTFDPQFWHTDAARVYSLMPRWYGKPGDWEAYAAQAAEVPGSLGAEAYARMLIEMTPFYSNLFRDARASWPLAREGLKVLREKYPDAIEFTSYAALLATMAFDRPTAQAMFAEVGDTYLPEVWPSPESFAHYRKWAQTGKW